MNILTFDIEEWFHILDNDSTKNKKEWSNYEYRIDANMDRIFAILDKYNQKATFFCLGWMARTFPHIIKNINELGYEVATHSDMHQLAYEQSRTEFENDFDTSIKSLEGITGKKIKAYRAPGFSLMRENKWVFDVLIERGIEIDCSIFPTKRAHGGFKEFGHAEPTVVKCSSGEIKEFPINLYNFMYNNIIFTGGGYFRLFPYWMIKHMMKRSSYVMTYFHPRDFDVCQPMIEDLSVFRKFKSYYCLRGALNKLEKLIRDYVFIDLDEAVKRVNWDKIKRVEVSNV